MDFREKKIIQRSLEDTTSFVAVIVLATQRITYGKVGGREYEKAFTVYAASLIHMWMIFYSDLQVFLPGGLLSILSSDVFLQVQLALTEVFGNLETVESQHCHLSI